jgi:hypothetical protein
MLVILGIAGGVMILVLLGLWLMSKGADADTIGSSWRNHR